MNYVSRILYYGKQFKMSPIIPDSIYSRNYRKNFERRLYQI